MAAKMTTIVGDVTGLQQPTTHKIYLILLRRSKAFHSRLNRFKILQHIKNFTLLPSLYHGGGMHLRVRPRVEMIAFLD